MLTRPRDINLKLGLNGLAVSVLLFAFFSLLAVVIHQYNRWKHSQVHQRKGGARPKPARERFKRVAYAAIKPASDTVRVRSQSLNAIPERNAEQLKVNASCESDVIKPKLKMLARRASSVSHTVITKSLQAMPSTPLTLSFLAGDFTLAELEKRKLQTDSHYKHSPQDTFVIFSGDNPVSEVVLEKSTQLAKMNKQGVVFFSQEERHKLSWDAKLKVIGSHGKGDQRYLGRLETTTVNGKTYGLLVFDSDPVTHTQLKRQYKHHH